MSLELIVEKKASLNNLIEKFLTAHKCQIKEFAKLIIGSLISACTVDFIQNKKGKVFSALCKQK